MLAQLHAVAVIVILLDLARRSWVKWMKISNNCGGVCAMECIIFFMRVLPEILRSKF